MKAGRCFRSEPAVIDPEALQAIEESLDAGTVVVSETGDGLAQQLLDGRHRLLADEPVESGGGDAGPNPYELILMALGACTSMTVRLYADRHKWPLEQVVVRLRHSRNHAQDCVDCETKATKLDRIDREISLQGPLDADQRARLLDIANSCPVHRTLESGVDITTRLAAVAG